MEFQVNVAFKEEYSKLVALFTHRYGYDKIELIEDAIQETFYKAVKLWPHNPPQNPKGWLRTVTRNQLIDKFREKKHVSLEHFEVAGFAQDDNWDDPQEIRDNHLKMIFACCHPKLKSTDQLLLSLKFLCGFGSRQIARALLKSEAAVEKAISRARVKFKSIVVDLQIPQVDQLGTRLDNVLRVIYLQFTEGYKVSEGEHLINRALCMDAIRLAELLTTYPQLNTGKLNALLALMYFQASRLNARVDPQGNLITLDGQDRSKWNIAFILQGSNYLGKALADEKLSHFHIEAAIASVHGTSVSYEETNWQAIINWYDLGLSSGANKHYQLYRLIAFRQIHSPQDTLKEVNAEQLPENQFTYVFLGDLNKDLGEVIQARDYYNQAIDFARNQAEKEFIQDKISSLQD
ncbi:MAG: sigma-70 family RNA polymerase sigma factor [Cyclobacteriaceae bacterium]|nr:sigma-70 family RNA polymerase sigma factor [Cyclobacteriaceae bacterium]